MPVQSTELEVCHDAIVPSGVGVLQNGEWGNAAEMLSEVLSGCVIGHELFAELHHGEGPAVLEACHEDGRTCANVEQILAILLEVVFGECIHHV